MVVIFCFILLIILLYITKVEIRVINILNDTDVYIKIGIIKIHLDYDMLVREVNKVVKETKFSFKEFQKGLGFYAIVKKIINKSKVNVNKAIVIKKNNTFNIFNIYLNTTYYTVGTFVKSFLISNTDKQNNISFYVIPSHEDDIDIDIDIKFSLFYFIKSFLFNIKNIIKIKKDMV